MAVYCFKKICEYNDACCVQSENKAYICNKEDILINDSVECDLFQANYNKLEKCIKCSKKSKVIKLNNGENKYANLKVNINKSCIKDFKELFTKENNK